MEKAFVIMIFLSNLWYKFIPNEYKKCNKKYNKIENIEILYFFGNGNNIETK